MPRIASENCITGVNGLKLKPALAGKYIEIYLEIDMLVNDFLVHVSAFVEGRNRSFYREL